MESKEGEGIQEDRQHDCETGHQIYMKLVAVKGGEGQLLSYLGVSEEMDKLPEGSRFLGWTRETRNNFLKEALLSMEAFGMIRIGERALHSADFSFRVTKLGQQYADFLRIPELIESYLEPIFEAER